MKSLPEHEKTPDPFHVYPVKYIDPSGHTFLGMVWLVGVVFKAVGFFMSGSSLANGVTNLFSGNFLAGFSSILSNMSSIIQSPQMQFASQVVGGFAGNLSSQGRQSPSASEMGYLLGSTGSDQDDAARIGVLSTNDVKNIIYNEVGSLSGPSIDTAYKYMAHTIFNDSIDAMISGRDLPSWANNTSAKIYNSNDLETYAAISLAVDQAYIERLAGINPIPDARYFSTRGYLSLAPRDMSHGRYDPVEWAAIFGPFNNSFTQGDTKWSSGGYIYIWFDERSRMQMLGKLGALE